MKDNNVNDKEIKNRKTTSPIRELISWIVIFVAAYLVAQFLTKCVIIKTYIESGSMIPELMIEDKVVGNRLSYLFSSPERGDVVFFLFPDNESKTYVKRVIGLPGDKVDIRDGYVYINDSPTPLAEPYVKNPDTRSFKTFYVPEDSYFMLGDNRKASIDSRMWDQPYVHEDKIIAKAWFRYWPFPIRFIDHADYE